MNVLPDELRQFRIGRIVRTPLVLALVHGTIHARLKERACRPVGASCDKLEEFVDVSVKIAPNERGLAFQLTRTEL